VGVGRWKSPGLEASGFAMIRNRIIQMAVGSVILTSALGQSARAQDNGAQQLQAFTKTQFYAGFLGHTFASLPTEILQRCPSLVSSGSQVTVIKQVTFAPDGYPNAGLWRQDFPVSACGNDTTLHLYFMATPDEKINSLTALSGSTHADLSLQGDAMILARRAVATARGQCQTFNVSDTHFDGYGSDASAEAPEPTGRRSWRETWRLSGCGVHYVVNMLFTPDASGTAIHVGPVTAQK
jgi:hypothetical protein